MDHMLTIELGRGPDVISWGGISLLIFRTEILHSWISEVERYTQEIFEIGKDHLWTIEVGMVLLWIIEVERLPI